MKRAARAWVIAGVVGLVLVAGLAWRFAAEEAPGGHAVSAHGADARDGGGAEGTGDPPPPQSEVHVLDPLVRPIPTAVPGAVTVEPGTGPDEGKTIVRWELPFSQGVWSLRFVLGSPDVELRFLDLSRAVSEDCHALAAVTERGPAPFPAATFDAATRTATLADMPLEVVEALTRARELTLVACDARFTLDDTQQRTLIDFYVQAAGAILDAVSADAGAPSAEERPETP